MGNKQCCAREPDDLRTTKGYTSKPKKNKKNKQASKNYPEIILMGSGVL